MEGTIGCGKSTLLSALHQRFSSVGCEIFPEPVQDWEPSLVNFYKDPSRHAFALQMRVLYSFLDRIPADEGTRIVLHERSPVACKDVFGHLLRKSGSLSEEESELFNLYYDYIFPEKERSCMFLYVDVNTAIARKEARSRTEDALIDKEYMRRLHDRYLQVCRPLSMERLKQDGICMGSSAYFDNVVVVDGARSPQEVADLACKALNILVPNDFVY